MRRLRVAIGWGLVATIVWLSVMPEPPRLDFEQSDKLGHFIAYGSLMFWFALLYPTTRARVAYGVAFIALGIGLEFVQGALGYRTFDVFDMVANTLGVLLGWAAALLVPRLRDGPTSP